MRPEPGEAPGAAEPASARDGHLPLAIDVLTLFPGWFGWLEEDRPVRNAVQKERFALAVHDLRAHAPGVHKAVDDAPYGGGAGMVIRVDIVVGALEATFGVPLDELRRQRRIVVLDPGGRQLDDAWVREAVEGPDLILLCGRYEGFDHRVHEHVAHEAVSLGPFVLAGGEVAAMAIVDSVVRHLPGALGHAESSREESFSPALEGRIEHPHYTRPESFRGWDVPPVLRSGDHARIADWRRQRSVERSLGRGRG